MQVHLYIIHLLIHIIIIHVLIPMCTYFTFLTKEKYLFRVDRDIVFLPGRVIHGSRWSVGRSFRHVVWSLVSPVGEVRVGGCAFI